MTICVRVSLCVVSGFLVALWAIDGLVDSVRDVNGCKLIKSSSVVIGWSAGAGGTGGGGTEG